MEQPSDQHEPREPGIYIEDALILVSIVLLFALAIFFRFEAWGQAALVGVFAVMLVVFVRRLRRVHRAFKGRR